MKLAKNISRIFIAAMLILSIVANALSFNHFISLTHSSTVLSSEEKSTLHDLLVKLFEDQEEEEENEEEEHENDSYRIVDAAVHYHLLLKPVDKTVHSQTNQAANRVIKLYILFHSWKSYLLG